MSVEEAATQANYRDSIAHILQTTMDVGILFCLQTSTYKTSTIKLNQSTNQTLTRFIIVIQKQQYFLKSKNLDCPIGILFVRKFGLM